MNENSPKIEEQENTISNYCPESEENIPLVIKGSLAGGPPMHRTNVITKFCWSCWHLHRQGVYKPAYNVVFPNVQYVCSACGHVVKK